jgi:hypothetical protein
VLSSANTTAIFAVLITFILAFFTILITKRNRILPMFRTLDKITKQELRRDFLAVVNKQALLLFFLLSLVLSLFSLFWFNRNLSTGFFNGITLGLSSLKFSGIIQVLIGNGMADSAGGKIWQLIYSYGLVPLLLLGYFLYRFTRDQITLLKSKLSLQISGLALALLSFLLTLTIFAFYFRGSSPDAIKTDLCRQIRISIHQGIKYFKGSQRCQEKVTLQNFPVYYCCTTVSWLNIFVMFFKLY